MGYGSDIGKAWNLLWHPERESKQRMDIMSSLKFYYEIGIVGMLAYVFVGVGLLALGISLLPYTYFIPMQAHFLAYSVFLPYYLVVFAGLLVFLVLFPVSIAVNAFLYQLVGKYLLKSWAGDYSRTFAAVTFSYMPVVLFFWLMAVPFLKVLIAVLAIWQIAVLIIALSEQQRTTRQAAFVAWLATLVLVALFAFLIMAFVLQAVQPLGLNSTVQASTVPYGASHITHYP
ncbi:MAG: hypothetical protein ACP5TJ_03025 [Candidatus Micrarchaeia archaeon]